MDEGLLNATLAAIMRERSTQFDESLRLVEALLADFGEDQLVARLYAAIPSTVPWEVVADLFGILIWSTSDNGHSLTTDTDAWLLDGNDLRKSLIALHLDTYPFRHRLEMEKVLTSLQARFPELAARCQSLVASRRLLPE
jgi:hypothetical protein